MTEVAPEPITEPEEEIMGCTNELADNYDSSANQDDGSCIISGCADPTADNYSADVNNITNEVCEYSHKVDNYIYENSRYSKPVITTVPDNIPLESAFPFTPNLGTSGYYYNTIKTAEYDNNHPCKQTGDYNFVDLLECAKPDLGQCVDFCDEQEWCTGFTTSLGQNVAKDGHPLYCTLPCSRRRRYSWTPCPGPKWNYPWLIETENYLYMLYERFYTIYR